MKFDISDDKITLDNGISVSKGMTLDELFSFEESDRMELGIVNEPFRTYRLDTEDYSAKLCFKELKLHEVHLMLLPHAKNTRKTLEQILVNCIGKKKKNYSWGSIMLREDLFCGLHSIIIRFYKGL